MNINLDFSSMSTILGTTFVVLKLTNVINWSWIWVLSPFWIPFLIFGTLFCVIMIAKTK